VKRQDGQRDAEEASQPKGGDDKNNPLNNNDNDANEAIADIWEAWRLAGSEGLGEGKRKLSWVWVMGLQFENLEDNTLLDGMPLFLLVGASSSVLTLV
jgi:hypothetical protein